MVDDKGKQEEDLRAEALRPRPIFLLIAGLFSIGAIFAYAYEAEIVEYSGGDVLPFAILLIALVLLALGTVLLYRNPRLGNRLLGYDAIMQDMTKEKSAGHQLSAGFKSDTGIDAKRLNTRRKHSRHTRRQYAKATRDMQNDKSAAVDNDAVDQTKTPDEGKE
ncbi:hypothetical protein GCM10017044_19120 [Kordiimonas sediminis]|uniref:Uncharacterized protein n=1 Tax=Kordiimonas sediminis TaxID=1735581 RepID=A0A919E6Q5_9PROT|nr:hypothetical protein [Kordiimonas sediminis]GHF24621.1 hypothetical protein GCM10017044_19120 [Kordiimonas sediminis]